MEMWGKCDGKDIVFKEVDIGLFECTVPADFEDGMYVLELWIKTNADSIEYTTAVVYLCDSKYTYFELLDDDIMVTIQDDIQVKVVVDDEHSIYQGREEICAVPYIEQEEGTDNNYRCVICTYKE